jgi:hypothetical protein
VKYPFCDAGRASTLIVGGADYSPDPTHGEFFRAVVNGRTTRQTVDSLIAVIEKLGD